jgi:hypothetical protein
MNSRFVAAFPAAGSGPQRGLASAGKHRAGNLGKPVTGRMARPVLKPSHREAILEAGMIPGRECARYLLGRWCSARLLHQSLPLQRGVCRVSIGPLFCSRQSGGQRGFGRQVPYSPAATEAVFGPHQRHTGRRQMVSRLPDRRFQSLDHLPEQTLARATGSNFPGMARSVCLVHRRGSDRR